MSTTTHTPRYGYVATVHHVTRTDGTKTWVLRWASPMMAGLSFWYYDTEEEANDARDRMLYG